MIDKIMTKWDENEYRDFLKEEAWNAGHESGVQEGVQKEIQDGIQKGIQETIRHSLRTCMNLGVSKGTRQALILKHIGNGVTIQHRTLHSLQSP